MKRLSIFLVVLIAILTWGAAANSDVFYSTFGAGYTYGGNALVIGDS